MIDERPSAIFTRSFQPCLRAAEQAFPDDPSDPGAVKRWIERTLDTTGYVATGWSPNALFLLDVERLDFEAFPVVGAAVWTEVIDPLAAIRAGWRSAAVTVEVECRSRRCRELARIVYAGPGMTGPARAGSIDPLWIRPAPRTTMATTVEAVRRRAGANRRARALPTSQPNACAP